MEIENGEESDNYAGERQSVEYRMQQFYVDSSEATADTVEQDRWNNNKYIHYK